MQIPKSETQISQRNISDRDISPWISGVRSPRGIFGGGYPLSGRTLGPEYLGLYQLGGILGRGIFLTETLGPEYLGLDQLGGILG